MEKDGKLKPGKTKSRETEYSKSKPPEVKFF